MIGMVSAKILQWCWVGMSKLRGNIIKAVDRWLPSSIPEVWNWTHTTEMLSPQWQGIHKEDGRIRDGSNILTCRNHYPTFF